MQTFLLKYIWRILIKPVTSTSSKWKTLAFNVVDGSTTELRERAGADFGYAVFARYLIFAVDGAFANFY